MINKKLSRKLEKNIKKKKQTYFQSYINFGEKNKKLRKELMAAGY